LQSGKEFRLEIYFSIGNIVVDWVHDAWTRSRGSGPPWIEAVQTRGLGGALPARGVRALGLANDGGGGRAGRGGARVVLTLARAATKRRHDGGKERRLLELVVRVKEGAKELRREGERGGEGQGLL
jgi:hypothetical protein